MELGSPLGTDSLLARLLCGSMLPERNNRVKSWAERKDAFTPSSIEHLVVGWNDFPERAGL